LPLQVRASLQSPPGGQPAESYLSELLADAAERPDLLIVPVAADGRVRSGVSLDSLLPASAEHILAAYGHSGAPGELAESAISAGNEVVRAVFVGIGDESPAALRRAGAEAGRRCVTGKTAVADLTGLGTAGSVAAFAEGALLGGYGFSLRSQPADEAGTMRLLVTDQQECAGPVGRAQAIAEAVAVARDLANTPSLGKSPQWLADEAARLTAERGVEVRIWADAELAASGFGGILAVGSGSARPPRLIELSYQPAEAQAGEAQPCEAQSGEPQSREAQSGEAQSGEPRSAEPRSAEPRSAEPRSAEPRAHIVLVGKGITFDSGGLSLKPNDNMMLMKTDMAGGGAVIAVMSALARLGVRSRVTGLIAAAENMPSGSAYRPGDVISQYGGTSVEVLNTDAEGRLVLADALAYAAEALAPDQIVDIATLTGAARVALGGIHAALYSTCDELAEALLTAGQVSGDRLWRMPLEGDYRDSLESPVADVAHVARDHNPAGSIIAALFLRDFAAGIPWAHLDIAGPGRSAAADGELSKGATGFGTRLLLTWLTAPSAG
jgi:leucyl aminopeptidase